MPFFAITLLAGLQTINPDLHEAAALDGANAWHRFWHVTWPLLLPVTLVVVVFSVIQTFSDFQLIYVLTGGGPANATHLVATYAYQIGVGLGPARRGRGDLALHVPGAVRGGLGAAALPEAHGRRVGHGHRAPLEEVALLLHPAGGVHRLHAVPVLLDGGHRVPAGPGALPLLARGERDAVLDARADPRALQRPAREHRVPAMAVEHDADRHRLDDHLAHLRDVRRLRARAAASSAARRSSARRSSSPTSCRRRCSSSRSPTSSATCTSATRRGR